MDVLVALGTTASYGYALTGVLREDEHAAYFFETAAVFICFVLAGKWMQAFAMQRTGAALSQLMQLQSKTAVKITPLKDRQHFNPMRDPFLEVTVEIQRVKVGDIVKVIRGSSIPADGRVLFGEMTVDESMVTGESMPVLKMTGAVVLGGTICVETSAMSSEVPERRTGFEQVSCASSSASSSLLAFASDEEESEREDNNNNNNNQRFGATFIQVTGVGSNTALA
jgi:cation transport ATPase